MAGRLHSKPLAGLIHENLIDLEASLFLKQNRSYDIERAKVSSAETGKKYDGLIIEVTERHVLQELKNLPNQVIFHDRNSLSSVPKINNSVEISYPHGNIGLVRASELTKIKDISKADDLGKKYNHHEEHERER